MYPPFLLCLFVQVFYCPASTVLFRDPNIDDAMTLPHCAEVYNPPTRARGPNEQSLRAWVLSNLAISYVFNSNCDR